MRWSDGQAADPALHLRHRAHPAELRSIRGRVYDWALGHAVPEDALMDLQLAVGEAIANGIEHAYRDQDPGTVTIDIELRHDVLSVAVTDEGRWRPVPERNGYRGRGLLVIERLARRVEILCSGGGTRICFEIPI